MKSTTRLVLKVGVVTLIALALVSALAVSPLLAVPNHETHAYYSVVRDEPFAPFTEADRSFIRRTSLVPYYSVVKDEPFAPFTEADSDYVRRTSLVPYWSVLH